MLSKIVLLLLCLLSATAYRNLNAQQLTVDNAIKAVGLLCKYVDDEGDTILPHGTVFFVSANDPDHCLLITNRHLITYSKMIIFIKGNLRELSTIKDDSILACNGRTWVRYGSMLKTEIEIGKGNEYYGIRQIDYKNDSLDVVAIPISLPGCDSIGKPYKKWHDVNPINLKYFLVSENINTATAVFTVGYPASKYDKVHSSF